MTTRVVQPAGQLNLVTGPQCWGCFRDNALTRQEFLWHGV